jgi:hypothetical protein
MSKIARVSLISPLGTAAQLVLGSASRRSGLLGSLSLSSLVAACGGGGGGTASTTTSASNNFGYVLKGVDAKDRSGFSVSSAGDVNKDGYDDLIIGAPFADPNDTSSGESYLVFGNQLAALDSADSTADGSTNLSNLNGTIGYVINGIDKDDLSGYSVSSAGDVNNDGYDDLLIGAYLGDPNGTDAGENYLVFGGQLANLDKAGGTTADGKINLSALQGTTAATGYGYIINGIGGDDYAGFSVSSAGDVNNDDYDDLLIGAYQGDPNDTNSGETYLVFGNQLANLDKAGGTTADGKINLSALQGTTAATGYGYIINGIDGGDLSGASVSSAGDVNSDGYDDLLIGAYKADAGSPSKSSAGETYLIFGNQLAALDTKSGSSTADGSINLSDLITLKGAAGYIIYGIRGSDKSGFSVSSAGDVNDDGYDDLLIGAYLSDPNDTNSGETYLVFGGQLANLDKAGSTTADGKINLSALNGTTGYIIKGDAAGDESGWSVSSAGDVNKDNYDDLLIGAHNADSKAGESYLIFGGDATHWQNFDRANSTTQDGVLELSLIA